MAILRRKEWYLLALVLALVLGGASEASAQSFAPNPPLTAGCGLDVVLVLDGSASIQGPAVGQVRAAAMAFVDALAGTGSRVALVEFADYARVAYSYMGASVAHDPFHYYLYNTYHNGSLGGSTNWSAAFQAVAAALGAPDLVIFMTDGMPTTPLYDAIYYSSMVKSRGSHIFGLGVVLTDPPALDNLKAVLNGSSSIEYDGSNFAVADYSLGTFDTLLDDLAGVAYELCAPSLTLTKLVDHLDGQGYQPAGGWEFSGQVTAAGGLSWVAPSTPNGDGRTGSTAAGGSLTFQWNTTDPQAGSALQVTETPVAGYTLVDVTCSVKSQANATPAPLPVTLDGTSFAADLGPDDIVTCEVRNQAQPGTIVISKSTAPAGGTGFAFSSDIPGGTAFDLDDGQSQTFGGLAPGSYTVSEVDPGVLYDLSGLTCTDPDGESVVDLGARTATLDLDPGETVSCTFTNRRRTGTVIIEKLTDTGMGSGFGFGTDILGGGGTTSFDLAAGESVVWADVPAGSYQVLENDPGPGYQLAGLTCDDPGGDSVVNFAERTAGIALDPGETVACAFMNDDLPPAADAGGPYLGLEGTALALDGSGSADGVGILLYEWDCTDDGTYDLSSASPSDGACIYPADGSYTLRLRVTDTGNQAGEATAPVSVANGAPQITALAAGPALIDENGSATLAGSFSDPGLADVHSVVIDWGDGSADTVLSLAAGEREFAAQHQYLDDDPTGTTSDLYVAAVTVIDDGGDGDGAATSVTVHNVAPVLGGITLLSPSPVIAAGEAIYLGASFSDIGTLDTHAATWDWGDGTTAGTVTESGGAGQVADVHTYAAPGVYAVSLVVTDDDLLAGSATLEEYVVVYDPSGGFVTGGGWIWSEPGWCQLDEVCARAEGKASFGFVSRYQKGAQVPSGDTELNFAAGGLNFHSDSYEWLVVNQNGANAQFKGTGTVNGLPAPGGELYGFMIWAQDQTPGDDALRVKIWYEVGSAEVVVYDNGFEQAIGGGSIVIHTGKGK
ncbi:MAG TPA: PKD domain-containing protein [Anaerolineae bacterium]|nr:PKD domain-containing protein [Anaerolineae bacterium]